MDNRMNFNLETTKFSIENALLFAKLSDIAYEKSEDIEKAGKSLGFKDFYFIQNPPNSQNIDVQGFILSNYTSVVLVFRGTEPKKWKDWVTNLKFDLKKFPIGEVHDGFLASLNIVWDGVLRKLKEFEFDKKRIWIAGHSQGGAIATLATAQLRNLFLPINGLYTFGSPRVGNTDFTNYFNAIFKERTFRFVNNNDIVPRIPPRIPLNYEHVGQLYFLGGDDKIYSDSEHWYNQLRKIVISSHELLGLANEDEIIRKVRARIEVLVPAFIDDHRMGEYIRKIEKNRV